MKTTTTKRETMTDDFGNECAEVRVLPAGGGGNILCGLAGYRKEMKFRRERIAAGVPFELPAWKSLRVYFPTKDETPNGNKPARRLTLLEANALVRECDRLFRRSARAWERGNYKQEQAFAERAEKLLAPLGIICSWPGLYPCLKVDGVDYSSTESAVSAAMEGSR